MTGISIAPVAEDVLIRVNPAHKLAMHIDTDEANASHIKTGETGYIEEIQSRV